MVKNILLIRHCQASPDSPTNSDFDRPLTAHGLKQAEILGQHIGGLELNLDAIYMSPSRRTLQTTKGIIDQLDYEPRLMDAEEIYEATDNVLRAVVHRFDPNFDQVALVAHNPAISLLANYLSEDFRQFTPGAMSWLSFEVDDWAALGRGTGVNKDFFST